MNFAPLLLLGETSWLQATDILPSGPLFLFVYPILALVIIGVCEALASMLANRLNLPHVAPNTRAEAVPYRQPQEHQRLSIGWLPKLEEHLAISYLRAGNRAVAETLVAQALAEKWLLAGPNDKTFGLAALRRTSGNSALRALYEGLWPKRRGRDQRLPEGVVRISVDDVVLTAIETATSLTPTIKEELRSAGFFFSGKAESVRYGTKLMGFVLVIALGVSKELRGLLLGGMVTPLMLEILVCAALGGLWLRVPASTSRRGKAYLRWLSETTESLKADVLSVRREAPWDVSLTVAAHGAVALPGRSPFPYAAFIAAYAPPEPVGSFD